MIDECGHWWSDEWHPSQDYCDLGITPCRGRGYCPSYITCLELFAVNRTKEEINKRKMDLIKDIPYEDVVSFVKSWNVKQTHLEDLEDDPAWVQ